MEMRCKRCGTVRKPDYAVCPECGTRFLPVQSYRGEAVEKEVASLKYYWDLLVKMGVPYEALEIVTDLCGYSMETLEDILFCWCGAKKFEEL